MIIVSKCLTGECCRYDGGTKRDEEMIKMVERGEAVAVCPEQLGGLPTPRTPSELTGNGDDVLAGCGCVITKDGRDVTREFIMGAEAALKIALETGAEKAILKARSPSCGCGSIYDGNFSGNIKAGDGVTAALFKRNGIEIETR